MAGTNTHLTLIDSTPMTNGSVSVQGDAPTGWWVDAKTDDAGSYNARAMVVCAS